jgi:(1->4)-alpha-D-glucan 1-alpha-D-glucosylmutase
LNAPAELTSLSLADQARRLGVADRFHGFWGKEERVPEAVLQRAVQAMAGDGRAPPVQQFGLPLLHVALEGEPAVLRWPSHENSSARWRLASEDTARELAGGELQRS